MVRRPYGDPAPGKAGRRVPGPAAFAIALAATGFALSASAQADDLVLLDFWSPTCGPCMQMKPAVQGLVNRGYQIRQIDASRERALVEQYRVTHLPCFILLKNGQELRRIVGATSQESLANLFVEFRGQDPASVPVPPIAQSPRAPGVGPPPITRTESSQQPPEPTWPPHDPASGVAPTAPNLLGAAVRLRVDESEGKLSYGTGTIIDARQGEALIITCGHLFRDSQGKAPVTVELFEATPQGPRAVGKVAGKVISYDLEREVALVSIRPNRPVVVAEVAPPQAMLERGDRVASIGCSNGGDPTILATRVNQLDRYHGPPNVEAAGAPVEGRSGGGLFNLQGQLVGVCYAADYDGNEGLYAALESIHGELDRVGLKDVYVKGNAAPSATVPPIVRGQELASPDAPETEIRLPDPGITPVAEPNQIAAVPLEGTPRLSAVEQATLEEIAKRAATHEVVCIIRPKEPGGQSEVITLDSASAEFIRALPVAKQPSAQPPLAR